VAPDFNPGPGAAATKSSKEDWVCHEAGAGWLPQRKANPSPAGTLWPQAIETEAPTESAWQAWDAVGLQPRLEVLRTAKSTFVD